MADRLEEIKTRYESAPNSLPYVQAIGWLIAEVERLRAALQSLATEAEFLVECYDTGGNGEGWSFADRVQALNEARLKAGAVLGGGNDAANHSYYGDNFEENVRARLRREGWFDHEPTEEEFMGDGGGNE